MFPIGFDFVITLNFVLQSPFNKLAFTIDIKRSVYLHNVCSHSIQRDIQL